jgi:hypothetical protein
VAAAVAAATGSATATATGDLDARIARLEAEIVRLRHEAVTDPAAVADRRAVVRQAIADAESRSSWREAAGPGTGGFDGRPVLRSADGDFELGLAAHVQARFVASRLGDAPPGEDSSVAGFELRRTRLKAVGHVLDERLRFQLGGGFSNDGDAFSITDAWAEWRDGDTAIRVGNFRPIFLREELTSAKRLPGIERSLVSRLVRQLRIPGVMAMWRGGPVRLHAALQDPETIFGGDAWQASARAEWRLAGRWRDLRQETGFRGADEAAALGFGVLHVGESGAPDRTQATADVLWTGDGWSLTLVGTLDDPEGAERAWGATVRGGWFASDALELVGRVQVGDAEDELLTVGAGANWYVDGHDLKLQGDLMYAIDGPGGRWRTSNTGWREESGDGQLVLRLQAQVAF